MARWVIPDRPHSPLGEVRQALDRIEAHLADLRGSEREAVHLLHLLDEVAAALDRLEAAGADVRAERGRLEAAWAVLRRRARPFLKRAGPALRAERERRGEEGLRPWWYLDQLYARSQRRALARWAGVALIALMALGAAWIAYERFLAPPPQVRQALRHADQGRTWVEAGDLERALSEFEAAAALTPDDPETWLWVGVLRQRLGDGQGAEEAYRRAMSAGLDGKGFLFQRGMLLLELGDAASARADAEEAVRLAPEWGYGFYLRGSVELVEGDVPAALADYQRAADLAHAAGDAQLEAMARAQIALILQAPGVRQPE